jgi:hypothetical protein
VFEFAQSASTFSSSALPTPSSSSSTSTFTTSQTSIVYSNILNNKKIYDESELLITLIEDSFTVHNVGSACVGFFFFFSIYYFLNVNNRFEKS